MRVGYLNKRRNPLDRHRLEIQACVFDAYGTLFDYASAASRCRDILGDRLDKLNALWREKQLQYTWLREIQGRHADFWQVTGDALDFAMESLGIVTPRSANG
jgi:2-haloacid dehalogenase